MELRRGHLRYFLAVAEEGQITRAARRLHLAQPALSQAIAQLEADLGVQLLDRHPRGVTLTPAGEAFLVRARAATSAWTDAVNSARSFAREDRERASGTLLFGFVGTPPGMLGKGALEAFSRAHPEIEVRFRPLSFPTLPISAWLEDVDVGVCHMPPADEDVWTEKLREEPRVLLVAREHPLAQLSDVSVADVLDETFAGFDPAVAAEWASFWSLDDHRGGPPRQLTDDRSVDAPGLVAALATGDAISAVPAGVARVVSVVMPAVVAVPVRDAAPCSIVLAGRHDRCSGPVLTLREAPADLTGRFDEED